MRSRFWTSPARRRGAPPRSGRGGTSTGVVRWAPGVASSCRRSTPRHCSSGSTWRFTGGALGSPTLPLSFSKYVTNDELDALTREYTEAVIGADPGDGETPARRHGTVYTPWPDVPHRLGRYNSFTSPGQARPHLGECTVSADRIDELVRVGRDYVVGPGWQDEELAVVRTFFAASGPDGARSSPSTPAGTATSQLRGRRSPRPISGCAPTGSWQMPRTAGSPPGRCRCRNGTSSRTGT